MKEEKGKDMTPVLLEDLGMRYPTEKSKKKKRFGLYKCQYCGKEFEAGTQDVKRGKTRSCGCYKKQLDKEKSVTHGLTYHPLYNTWNGMKQRCINPREKGYENYGARGIEVCERWLDIKNFIEDMYPSWEEGLTLDRVDVNGNYEVGNCRWATPSIQQRNTKDIQTNNTSGFRGVWLHQRSGKWHSNIKVNSKLIYLGSYKTALEAAKAYEIYVRIHNLEHNFTPALTEEEIKELRLSIK